MIRCVNGLKWKISEWFHRLTTCCLSQYEAVEKQHVRCLMRFKAAIEIIKESTGLPVDVVRYEIMQYL